MRRQALSLMGILVAGAVSAQQAADAAAAAQQAADAARKNYLEKYPQSQPKQD
mgnify:CR=1 FL=1